MVANTDSLNHKYINHHLIILSRLSLQVLLAQPPYIIGVTIKIKEIVDRLK